MSGFWDAYSGEKLSVSDETHARLRRLFPEIDLPSFYRTMDAYLLDCPKSRYPRNIRKFLITCARREKTCTLRASEAFAEKQDALRKEIYVGQGPIAR